MVNLQCSAELRMFLCALYAPVCTEYGRITLPCRRLCLQARSDCYKLMDMFGVSWPEEMDCNRLVQQYILPPPQCRGQRDQQRSAKDSRELDRLSSLLNPVSHCQLHLSVEVMQGFRHEPLMFPWLHSHTLQTETLKASVSCFKSFFFLMFAVLQKNKVFET